MFESQCKIGICLHQWLCLPLETCLSCAEHIVEPAAEAAAQPVHQPARAQAEIPQDLAAVGAGPLPGAAGPAAGNWLPCYSSRRLRLMCVIDKYRIPRAITAVVSDV